jgi:hypothetical protein
LHRGGGCETSTITNDNKITTTTTSTDVTTTNNGNINHHDENNNDTDDSDRNENNHDDSDSSVNSVQLHDIVRIDFIGYYCNDITKQTLFSLLPNHHSDDDNNHNSNDTDDHITTTTTTTTNDKNKNQLKSLLESLPIFQYETNILCCIGDKDVVPALEMGLRFMSLYDTAIIYSHSKYAYGISTRTYNYTKNNEFVTYTLPSLSNVIYQVTIHEIIHSTTTTTTTTTSIYNDPVLQIQLCQSKKHLANDIYQNDIIEPKVIKNNRRSNNIDNDNDDDMNDDNTHPDTTPVSSNNNTYNKHRAIHIYQRIIERLDHFIIELQQQVKNESNNNHNNKNNIIQQAQQIQIDCYNNISAVYMKCHLYHLAKETCVQQIIAHRDPHNIKALYRIAKASIYDPSSSYQEVQATIQALQDELNYMIRQGEQQQLIVTSDNTTSSSVNNSNTNNNENSKIIHQLKIDIQKLKNEYKVHYTKYKQQQQMISTNIATKLNNKNNNATKINNTKQQQQPSPNEKSTVESSSERDRNKKDDIRFKNKNRRNMILYMILLSIFVVIGILYIIIYYFITLHPSSTNTTTTTTTTKIVSNEPKRNEL